MLVWPQRANPEAQRSERIGCTGLRIPEIQLFLFRLSQVDFAWVRSNPEPQILVFICCFLSSGPMQGLSAAGTLARRKCF